VHHDLSFLDVGRKWSPPADKDRLERYDQNRKLYEGDHDEVFGNWHKTLRQDLNASIELVINFPRRLSNLWASLLVGEPPVLKLPKERQGDEEAKQRLTDLASRGIIEAFRECVLDMSRYGDGLLKARLDEDGPVIEAISPEIWFPVVSRSNIREITHHVLAWKFQEAKPDGLWAEVARQTGFSSGINDYLYIEVHERNRVEYRLHHLTAGGYIGKEVDEEKRQELFPDWQPDETHGAGFLVVHVPNPRATNRLYGYDDYKDLEGPLSLLETTLAQWHAVNELHGFPVMAGPPIEPPEADSTEAIMVATGERYITVDPGAEGQVPSYIQRDLNVESLKTLADYIKEWMFVVSNTSPTAFGISETGYAESGTSLALRMQNETERASEMRLFLDPAAKEIIRVATALESSGAEIENADIGWRDGLPTDDNEQKDRWTALVAAKLASRKRAIMHLYDLSEEEADAELEAIEQDVPALPETANGNLVDVTTRKLEEALNGASENGNAATDRIPPEPRPEL
jgi:hypothetical protein